LTITEEELILPNIKSAKKRVLVTIKKNARNKSLRSELRTVLKSYDAIVAEGKLEEAKVMYPAVAKKIDMAVTKGIIHKNNADRKKSRLANKLNNA
jgi:small subunit ribosomal protein S20